MVSRGSCTEADRDRPEGAPNALNSKALPVGWVQRPADGVDRSGHGAKDFLEVLRACLARSGIGAEPGPQRGRLEGPGGAFYYWGQMVEFANKW
jgi:hypothetical protein